MNDRVLVPFDGPGEGLDELSWGQQAMWNAIRREGQSITVGGVAPLSDGTTLEHLTTLMGRLMGRHPALRTRLRPAPDGSARQQLFSSGVLAIDVVEAGSDDPAELAARICDEYRGRDFDYAGEWPVRMAIVCRDGRPTHTVAVYLHVQIDALGLQVLIADIDRVDPVTGQAPPVTALGPLEQARAQRGRVARQQSTASLRHLEKVLRTVPLDRLPGPPLPEPPTYPLLVLRSRALRLASRLIGARLAMDTSPVLLGLYATAVARRYGGNPFLAMIAVSNRFRPGLADSVSNVVQISACQIDLAETDLATVFLRSRRAVTAAYKYGYFAPTERQQVLDRVATDRGGPVDLSCFFSDRRAERDLGELSALPTEADIRLALAETTLNWQHEAEEIPEKLYLTVEDPDTSVDASGAGSVAAAGDAVQLALTADSRYLSPADMIDLLRRVEAIAVEAVTDPSAASGVPSIPVAV